MLAIDENTCSSSIGSISNYFMQILFHILSVPFITTLPLCVDTWNQLCPSVFILCIVSFVFYSYDIHHRQDSSSLQMLGSLLIHFWFEVIKLHKLHLTMITGGRNWTNISDKFSKMGIHNLWDWYQKNNGIPPVTQRKQCHLFPFLL